MARTELTLAGKPRQRKWFEFRDSESNPWVVKLVLGWIEHNGEHCRGITELDKRKILISAMQTRSEVEETFWHESIHMACGLRVATSNTQVEESKVDALESVEEHIAYASERNLKAMARSMGWLFPSLPRGVKLKANT